MQEHELEEFSDVKSREEIKLPVFSSNFETTNQELPTFSDNTMQTSITGTVNNKSDDFEYVNVPLPPPELRANPAPVRLQDLEDEYLEEQISDDEIEEDLPEIQGQKEPIFVNTKDYGILLGTLSSTKNNIKYFKELHLRLEDLSISQENEIAKIKKIHENIQRKFIMMDNRLFEK